jgi:hypothetical protein
MVLLGSNISIHVEQNLPRWLCEEESKVGRLTKNSCLIMWTINQSLMLCYCPDLKPFFFNSVFLSLVFPLGKLVMNVVIKSKIQILNCFSPSPKGWTQDLRCTDVFPLIWWLLDKFHEWLPFYIETRCHILDRMVYNNSLIQNIHE